MVRAGIAAAVIVAALTIGGCARNACSDWAQTSPIIQADASNAQVVSLGMRGG